MIQKNELRIGNMVYVDGHRDTFFTVKQLKERVVYVKSRSILQVEYEILLPVNITYSTLVKCGFTEAKENPLKPAAIEYILPLPIFGENKNEIFALIHNQEPKKTFAKARINGLNIGNNLSYLHQIQNIYHALAGKEMEIINP